MQVRGLHYHVMAKLLLLVSLADVVVLDTRIL